MQEIVIYLIYANKCNDCEEMRLTLLKAINDNKSDSIVYRIVELNSETDEAIDMAIENDISDIPACIIGEISFSGSDSYTYDAFNHAIKKAWKDLEI